MIAGVGIVIMRILGIVALAPRWLLRSGGSNRMARSISPLQTCLGLKIFQDFA
jgi:hypothetical protein